MEMGDGLNQIKIISILLASVLFIDDVYSEKIEHRVDDPNTSPPEEVHMLSTCTNLTLARRDEEFPIQDASDKSFIQKKVNSVSSSPVKATVVRRSPKGTQNDDQVLRDRSGQQLAGNTGGQSRSQGQSGSGTRRQQNRQRGGATSLTTSATVVEITSPEPTTVENDKTTAPVVVDTNVNDRVIAGAAEESDDESSNAANDYEPAYPTRKDRSIGVVEDWMRTAKFVADNREKLVLYASLGIALGAIFVLLVIVLLSYRQRQSRRGRSGQSSSSSRAALNPNESAEVQTTNLYSPSPASSTGSGPGPAPTASSSWWTQRGDDFRATPGRSPSGLSGQNPRQVMTSTPNARTRSGNTSSAVNGWVSETDILVGNGSGNRNAFASGTSVPLAGNGRLGAGGDRRGQFMDELDNNLSMTSSDVRRSPFDDQTLYGSNRNETGSVGTLGRSYTNPYRHDNYRSDGVRTMQPK